MQGFIKEHQDRALAILKSVEGLSITEAQWLLEWCSDYLLEQKVCFKKEKEHEKKAAPEVEVPRRPFAEEPQKGSPLPERAKLDILGCIFREMWETVDPLCSRYEGRPRLSIAERFSRLDELWLEAAGVMAAETYPDRKEQLVEYGSTRGTICP